MKILARETWQIVRLNWKNVLLFEFLYRAITLPVFLRFANRGLRFALGMAGYSYLTAGNIGIFLIKPWTLVAILVVGIVGMMLLMLEIAALVTAFEGSAYGQRLTPLHILWGGLQKVAEETGRKNLKLCGIVLLHYFLINLFFIWRTLTHTKPVNFVMREMMQEPWMRILLVALLVGSVLLAVPGLFACYGCMVEQKTFADSMARSRRLLQRHKIISVGLLAACNVTVILLIILAYLISVFVAAVFVVAFTDKNLAMAVLLSVSDKLELLLLFVGGIILLVVHIGALSVLYYQYGNRRYHEARWDFSYPAKGTESRRRIGMILCVIVACGLLYIFDLVYSGSALSDEILVETRITAHRGSSKVAPENTIAAVEAAIGELADYVEVDVQMTSDGVVALGHDANLKRVAGVNRAISSFTWEELQRLDVGSWFSDEFAGERIPSLLEVMDLCKGRVSLNIEIKNVGKGSALPEAVAGLILDRGMEEHCVVTSTSLNYLKQVKEIAPGIHTGYIISAAYGDFYSSDAIDFISIRSSFVNETLVENAHTQGKAIHAWTVNTKSEMERLRLLGVDNLITDYPVLAREIIYREEATETLLEYLRLVFR